MPNETSPSLSPEERRAALALTLAADIGPVAHQELVGRFRSASRAFAESCAPVDRARLLAAAEAQIAAGAARGVMLCARGDPEYPAQLLELHDPPPVLWCAGSWSTLRAPIVAVVGTRRATSYGLRVARELASALARAGACIVSGMALGIDAAAHGAALEAGGRTVAVLGTGADVAYPRANVALHRRIWTDGLVLSELPPGARSDRGSFPRRNRIIAALASLTIVVEAPLSSGALITARVALDLGRDVAMVPGPIDSPQSAGTNEFLRDGAHAVASIDDALMLAGLPGRSTSSPGLESEAERRVWEALADGAASLDELCARSGLPVAPLMATVTALEMRGVVECALTGEVRRR